MTQPTLRQATGSPFTRIYSVGAARGDLDVPNDDIVGPIDSSDEWIRQRTGVITFHGSIGARMMAIKPSAHSTPITAVR